MLYSINPKKYIKKVGYFFLYFCKIFLFGEEKEGMRKGKVGISPRFFIKLIGDSMKGVILILIAAMMAFCSADVKSQEAKLQTTISTDISLYFQVDNVVLDSGYMHNAISLEKLERLLSDSSLVSQTDSIIIKAAASIEGSSVYNHTLCSLRAAAIKDYILRKYPYVKYQIISSYALGENWEGLRRCVEQDADAPCQREVLSIIGESCNSDAKERRLRRIDGGAAWRYITKHFLAHLRFGSVEISVRRQQLAPLLDEQIVRADSSLAAAPSASALAQQSVCPSPIQGEMRYRRPLALKTNLLFDLATLLNIEVEMPLSKRWSVCGEWMFPWWLCEKKQRAVEILSGNLEMRYYLKPNYRKQDASLGEHNPLSGWFVGVYGGAGLYDLEWGKEGYQGEFFIATGISAGYVQPLSRSLSMEYSLGIGYLKTDYRHYEARFSNVDNRWHLIRQQNGSYSWFGPTKIKVSLIWYPHFGGKKRGGKR